MNGKRIQVFEVAVDGHHVGDNVELHLELLYATNVKHQYFWTIFFCDGIK